MEYKLTDSGINEYGGVLVSVTGPDYATARRKIAAHSRKMGYGRWISCGGSHCPDGPATVSVYYIPK
jgi:hypothetical protein